MPQAANYINDKTSILLSRNRPVALVVGAAGFIGSFIVENLLQKEIQVIGIDELGDKKNNLAEASKNKHFHFIDHPISKPIDINIPRLDYAFFVPSEDLLSSESNFEVINFFRFVEDYKPKLVLVSSIDLYSFKLLSSNLLHLKNIETKFAKRVKEKGLNARIVRVGPVFGPRMSFFEDEPISRLIRAYLLQKLEREPVSADLAARSLYIEDAADLIVKSILVGSTNHKIYDAVSPEPISVDEIKQILLDPIWHELAEFKPSQMPSWPTPNLAKTQKELSWKPKTNLIQALKHTIAYFKDVAVEIPQIEEKEQKIPEKTKDNVEQISPEKKFEIKEKLKKRSLKFNFKLPGWQGAKKNLIYTLTLIIIGYGLVYPLVNLGVGAFSIRYHLDKSQKALSKGDFTKAIYETNQAKSSVAQMQDFLSSISILKKGGFEKTLTNLENILEATKEGIDGVTKASYGMAALYQTTKIISGEKTDDPKPFFEIAQRELSASSEKISKVQLILSDEALFRGFPRELRKRAEDLNLKLNKFSQIISKAKTASYLLPQVIAIEGKKVYLVLIQNNLELRPTGGFIGSYARLEFEKGKISSIKVDDIYNLDGQLKDHIEPPPEIKNDLGQKDYYLRDSNFEPDFPTSSKQAEFFYRKEAGENVQGVFALDLTASAYLIKALGGLDLPDYGEQIDENNLFEKVITHAEVDFFPGSQAKRNYLTALQTQLFNKLFFMPDQDWPAIVESLGNALEEKHLLIYLSDPQVFSYLASQNWAGVLPRGGETIEGETNDFLMAVESNMGANKSNYYLERGYRLETTIGKENEVFHHLVINYKNNSPSNVFPAGKYKNRIRVYLPSGARLTKATFGESDFTKNFSAFSDYERSGFSTLIEILPKEVKTLTINYQLAKPLSFKGNINSYRLDIIKQPGTGKDVFEWNLTYPINMVIKSDIKGTVYSNQEINLVTNLQADRSFLVNFEKK